MKQTILLISLTLGVLIASAQTSKNYWMVGGNAGLNSKINKGANSTKFEFSPRIGYFVKDNLALGVAVKVEGENSTTNSSFGPFIRYYFATVAKNVKVFGGASYNFINDEWTQFDTKNNSVGIQTGLAVFITNSVAFESALEFERFLQAKSSDLGIKVGFQVHIK